MEIRYVIVGNFSLDTVVSPSGERTERQLGGTAVYGAAGARIWSEAVGICTPVGHDYAETVNRALAAVGIDTRGVTLVSQPHGLVWFTGYFSGDERIDDAREYPMSSDRDRAHPYVQSGSARHRRLWPRFSPTVADVPTAYSGVRGVHLAPMPVQRLTHLAAWFREWGARVSIDWPFWRRERRKTLNRSLLSCVDSVLPSVAEFEQYHTGDWERSVDEIAAAGPSVVIVKRGSVGVRVYDMQAATVSDVPAYPAVVRDPTGAGDAFCGGYTVGFDETGDPVKAATYGVVSASFVIEQFGALHAVGARRVDAEERRTQVERLIVRRPLHTLEAARG